MFGFFFLLFFFWRQRSRAGGAQNTIQIWFSELLLAIQEAKHIFESASYINKDGGQPAQKLNSCK